MADRLKEKTAIVFGTGSSGPGWGNGKAAAVAFAREEHGLRVSTWPRSARRRDRRLHPRRGRDCPDPGRRRDADRVNRIRRAGEPETRARSEVSSRSRIGSRACLRRRWSESAYVPETLSVPTTTPSGPTKTACFTARPVTDAC